jgi:hypothetical protein
MRWLLLVPALFSWLVFADEADEARRRWEASPHGPMLERILPPTFDAVQLPEPGSRGAALTLRYCVQCHNVPNPAMHHAQKWPGIVERMVLRMEGRGNLGELMAEMMAGVKAPSEDETVAIIAYLRKHAQTPLDPARYPEAPHRRRMARGGRAHAGEHGVDEPRGRHEARARRAAAAGRRDPRLPGEER